MLHHHGGAGAGSPYMAPTTAGTDGTGTAPFSPTPTGPAVSVTDIVPVAATPTMQQQPAVPSVNFEELPAAGGSGSGSGAGAGAGASAAASIQDDDMHADFGASGAGASGSGGHHRWPREETLALIRIRTEMDADFRNAPLKAPLWEDVARKLAGLGYQRSAKKCKEKFENVDKYYKRTKDARAGRQDGKSYRFFSQLEALHAAAPQQHQQPPPPHSGMGMTTTVQAGPHQPPMAMAWTAGPSALGPAATGGAGLPDLSFSSMSGSESDSEYDSDDDDDSDAGDGGLGSRGECDREMMALFEGMMKQVTDKQDAMQRVFLETLERWEAERTAREEAWRRQEVARINREREQLARERAAAASRDAALIAFLQRVGAGQGQPQPQPQPVRLPPHSAGAGVVPATPMPDHRTPSSPRHDAAATSALQLQQLVSAPLKAVEALVWAGGEGSGSTSSSRWPKEEVEALIQMRNEKDEQYQDNGAKGPLWEDIAAGMRRIGYNRSAKRCKEKWENINKYYKKVKESNKRRPEDSKTCPYFHQLDAMYRKKHRAGGSRGSRTAAPGANVATAVTVAIGPAATVQNDPSQRELEGKSSNDVDNRKNDEQGIQVHTSPAGNGGDTAPTTTPPPGDGAKNKTAEDNVNETNVQHQQQEQFSADETDSDDDISMTRDHTVYPEEGNDEDKMKYKMGVQKPDMIESSGNVPAPPPPPPPAAAAATAVAPTSSAAPTSSTFLAVQ